MKKVITTVSLNKETYDILKKLCEKENRSKSNMVDVAILNYELEKY